MARSRRFPKETGSGPRSLVYSSLAVRYGLSVGRDPGVQRRLPLRACAGGGGGRKIEAERRASGRPKSVVHCEASSGLVHASARWRFEPHRETHITQPPVRSACVFRPSGTPGRRCFLETASRAGAFGRLAGLGLSLFNKSHAT